MFQGIKSPAAAGWAGGNGEHIMRDQPLQTLRADIDYGSTEANTTYGKIRVKVWIQREVLPTAKEKDTKGGENNYADAQKG